MDNDTLMLRIGHTYTEGTELREHLLVIQRSLSVEPNA